MGGKKRFSINTSNCMGELILVRQILEQNN